MPAYPIISYELYGSDDPRLNTGHTVTIPYSIFKEYATNIDSENPLIIELKTDTGCIVFGNIDTTTDDVVIAPTWAISKLNLEPFSQVDVGKAENVRKVKYMKVWSDVSDYAYWDRLKEKLENKLINVRAVSVGMPFIVSGNGDEYVEFYILELRDEDNIQMLDGDIFEADVEIDFDTPSDILERERAERAELERIQKDQEEKLKAKEEEERRKAGNILGGEAVILNSREARAAFYAKRYGNI